MLGFDKLKGEGNPSTLLMAFLYFDLSFMIWTILGSISSEIADTFIDKGFAMTPSEEATLLTIPILSGALLRIVFGYLVGKVGPKKSALIAQSVVILTLFYIALFGASLDYNQFLLVGIGLGFAGASFAIALPQAGQWYPQRLKGVVFGIASIGNMGVVLGFLFAPKIIQIWGWQVLFLFLAILSVIFFLLYLKIVKDAPKEIYMPRAKKLIDYIRLFKEKDTWWFNLFYAVSFGAFVGFAIYMKVYLLAIYFDEIEIFGEEILGEENIHVVAGGVAAFCILAGALFRPVGGAIADKIGGIKSLYIFLLGACLLSLVNVFTTLSFALAVVVMFLIMANLGMANGALFQLVPQRFPKDIGIMTGIIGASGALGGVIILQILGVSTLLLGNYSIGFILIAIATLIAVAGLSLVKSRWRTTWSMKGGAII